MQVIFDLVATSVFGVIAAAGGFYAYLGFREPKDACGFPIGWMVGAAASLISVLFASLSLVGLCSLISLHK